MRAASWLFIAVSVVGCGPASRQSPITAAPPTPPPVAPAPVSDSARGLPSLVVATSSTVVMAEGASPTRFATPRPGLPLLVRGEGSDGRDVIVQITGGIELAGLVARNTLGVLVCEAGPLGDRYYAGAGNLLTLRSPVSGGRVRVAGEVVLPGEASATNTPRAKGERHLSFEASIEESRLCRAPPGPRHAGTMDDPDVLHAFGEVDEDDFPRGTPIIDVGEGTAITLLAEPGGAPLYTHPANQAGYALVVVRRQGSWMLVAAGGGPYVLGWIAARPERPPGPMGGLGLVGNLVGPKWPAALGSRELLRMRVHRLEAGTEVRSSGDARARLTRAGFARVTATTPDRVHVVAAVDDDVLVEGWISPGRLGPKVKDAR